MEAFRWQILIMSLFVSSYAEPNLVVREEIDGQWGDSGIIPCTYAPSPEYVEETVVWYFSGNAILRLVDSVPHTLVNKYRERISLSRSHPGDVSLRINDLQMMDKGQYTCEVVWRSKQSNDQIQEDAITKLNVIKVKISVTSTAKKPMIEVTSTQGPGPTEVALTTKKPMIEVTSARRPGSTEAEPNLVVREEIDGQWGDSGIIPCTYAPSPEYVEETVVWYFSGNAILRLVDSVPHTLVNKYRERISLSRSHPGDVSLRINDLQMMDKGQYTCEVVWRSKQSNDQIHEDAITKLNVIKAKISVTSTAKKPMIEVTSTQGPGLTEVALTTKKPMIEVTSTRRPGSTEDEPSLVIREEIDGQWRGSVIIPCTYAPSTEYVEENIIWSFGGRVILRQEESVEHVYLTKDRGRLRLSKSHPGDASLSINDLQMDDKGQYNCEVVWRLKSTDGLLQKDATTKLNIIRAVWATTTLGIPLYLLILICVLCIAVVGIVACHPDLPGEEKN
ncbi:uncharacterized protein LOC115094466 [Rhinatrema bivittatum]|uniref:uncharacterized protein LOC115094466 n=1 Tax=Rhinatrema bivittatum TaxID=194408 RepID=UPI00112BD2EA|nr:uncharacterized protein LOC115094466 [Rhinatrema bivittatum]